MTDEIEKLRKAVSAGHFEPSSGGHSLLTHCPECGRKLTIVADDEMGVTGLLCFSCWTMRVPVRMVARVKPCQDRLGKPESP